jgi:hypothetical protein
MPQAEFRSLKLPKNDLSTPPLSAQRNATLSVGSLIRSSYLLYLSQPAADRVLFKAMKGRAIRSIVEIGVGLGGRTERLFEVAAWRADCLPIKYCGIDLFDSRPANQPRLTLKRAHHDLRATGATIRLVPGEPAEALHRSANALTGTDLLVVGANQDAASMTQAWRYVPRMIHPQSLVFVQDASGGAGKELWRQLRVEDVDRLATESRKGVRRAA